MRNVLIYVLIALSLVLLWEWKCNAKSSGEKPLQDTIAILKHEIVQAKTAHKITKTEDQLVIDSLTSLTMALESRLKSSTIDFENKGKEAVKYSTLYKQAKQDRDTLMIFENCDSMSQKVDDAEVKYAVVKIRNDSLKDELKIAESTYQLAVGHCLADYDTLVSRTERKDTLAAKQELLIAKTAKKKNFWLAIKSGLIGIILGILSGTIKR